MLGAPRRFHDEPRLPRKRRTSKKLPYRPPAFDRNGKLDSSQAHFNHAAAKQRIEQCIMSANERAEPCYVPTKQKIEPCRDPVNISKLPPRYSEKYAPLNFRSTPRSVSRQPRHQLYRDEPRMVGTQFEKRDLFLNAVPSNVGEDDIKKALAVYRISTIRVTIRQRVNDNTRFGFVTPQSADDFEQMKQLGSLHVKGTTIPIRVSREKNEEDEDSRLKARISVLLRKATELGINLKDILNTPSTSSRDYSNELSRTSCQLFHAVKDNCEEVRLTRSLRVDPTTNEAEDSCRLKRDPMEEATFDDVKQHDSKLDDITKFYSTPTRLSSSFRQLFDHMTSERGEEGVESDVEEVEVVELEPTNSMLRSLHLERAGRNSRGAGSSLNNLDKKTASQNKSVSENSDSYHTPRSSRSQSTVKSEDHVPTKRPANHVTSREVARGTTQDSGIFQSSSSNNFSGASATGFPSLNPNTPPASPCRYLIDNPEELDNWFGEDDVTGEETVGSDRGSPMSFEETFDLADIPLTHHVEYPNVSIESFEPGRVERTLDAGQFQRWGNLNGQDPHSLILQENVLLLELFRDDLVKMVKEKDFEEFEGIALQVNQIFGLLVDLKLVSQNVIDLDVDVVLEELKISESRVLDVLELIKEIESEDSEDEFLQELKDDNLKESETELKERKADLLILQITNVVDFEFGITNPETSHGTAC
ncbi:uncharacterized protein LOC134816000 isoform X2 [Bolinopsis microptera]|uniref:uncharacterized protein LOC134816000 isoform X2 n=3 Tax=Bolinopsis microptera TaxID=2820187 RepID=UPI0030796FAB